MDCEHKFAVTMFHSHLTAIGFRYTGYTKNLWLPKRETIGLSKQTKQTLLLLAKTKQIKQTLLLLAKTEQTKQTLLLLAKSKQISLLLAQKKLRAAFFPVLLPFGGPSRSLLVSRLVYRRVTSPALPGRPRLG